MSFLVTSDCVKPRQLPVKMEERYVAAMVLSGVGDAMGYKGGRWEFTFVGEDIHKDLKKLGGIEKLHLKCKYI